MYEPFFHGPVAAYTVAGPTCLERVMAIGHEWIERRYTGISAYTGKRATDVVVVCQRCGMVREAQSPSQCTPQSR